MLYVITPLLAFDKCLPQFFVPIYDCCEGCSFRCRGEFPLLLLQSTMQPMQVCWQWGCWGWQMRIYSQGTAFIWLQIYSESLTQKPLMWHMVLLICRMSQFQEDTKKNVLSKAEKLEKDGWDLQWISPLPKNR